MSSYTMELRAYIESFSQYDENLTTNQRIEIGRKKLFDFDYPIFDEKYKAVFETNFIRKFYMREIGFETEGLFKFQLETWLLINMPYFNKLFESEQMKYDPLTNSKMDSNSKRTRDTNSKVDSSKEDKSNGTRTNEGFNRNLESDTPDNRLAITTQDGKGIIQYASSITEDANKSTNTNNDTNTSKGNTITDITNTESYIQNRIGKVGSVTFSKMMMEYRQSLLRIENKMFDEMQQLFMLVY